MSESHSEELPLVSVFFFLPSKKERQNVKKRTAGPFAVETVGYAIWS
jgi:hypothetical protein